MAGTTAYPLPRERNLILGGLLVLAAAAWALLVWQALTVDTAMAMLPTMGLSAPLFLATRAVIRPRGLLFDGLAKIDLLFFFHELGEVRDIEKGVAFEANINEG